MVEDFKTFDEVLKTWSEKLDVFVSLALFLGVGKRSLGVLRTMLGKDERMRKKKQTWREMNEGSYHEVTLRHPWAVLQHLPKHSLNTWGMAFINCPQADLHDMCWKRFLLDVTVSLSLVSGCLCHRYTLHTSELFMLRCIWRIWGDIL